ncbi:glycosyltransferase family 39 protein [Rhizophagus clarus]|uniref:Glycosyltransferase family 39 protein n=1 Tax=Rhizophagus clarus TaxID=94130 RepID=A0A8H3LHD4_9GLOM|nr:glycosyltransferase family 39 protein [Rhizophagus clarus]
MIINNNELPEVTNEVSITLRLNILSHDITWACVFHKGEQNLVRTPSLWLTPSKSALHARFSLDDNLNAGLYSVGNGLLLNRWYHLAYTLSDTEKRLDFYIDGKWTGFQSIQPTEQIIFNVAPLYIGNDTFYNGITGQISNFRYFNWSLSADEVTKDFSNDSSILSPVSTTQPTTTPTLTCDQPTQPIPNGAIIMTDRIEI